MDNKIKIKGVNCEKPTWRTLDQAIAKHFKEFFIATEKDTTEYWISSDLLRRITNHDLRVIIQEGDVETDVIRVYIDLLRSDAGKLKAKVGFLRIDAAVRHIKKFIHVVNLTEIRFPGDSQDLEVTREKCKGEDDKENLIIVEKEMTEEEKETRNWILQNNVVETDYELYEDFECLQQNTTS